MNKSEVGTLLDEIDLLYPGRIRMDQNEAQARFNLFCKILANKDAEMVQANLFAHVEVSPHPPSVHDLVKQEKKSTVPSVEETLERIRERENLPEPTEETKEAMRQAQKEIRKLLNIDIDGGGSE